MQFAVGEKRDFIESQLGRGLCYAELGDADSAVRDFKLVIDDANVSAERKAKARLALLDAYGRAGRLPDALRYSDELLRSGTLPAGDVALVKFYRLQTLFDAAEKQGYRGRPLSAGGVEPDGPTASCRQRLGGQGRRDDGVAIDDQRSGSAGRSPRVKWELARMMLAKNDYDDAAQHWVRWSPPATRQAVPTRGALLARGGTLQG